MKKFKIKAYLVMLLCIVQISCNKYLDIKSNFGQETPNTLESLRKLLDSSNEMNLNVPSYGEVSSDDYFLDQNTFDGFTEDTKKMYLWENYIYYYSNDWANAYVPVYQSNLVLDLVENVEGDRKKKDEVAGAALFYRAFQFLSLVWTYSNCYDINSSDLDLGIALRLTSDQSVPSVRSSVAETYSKIIEDLKKSISLLPEQPSHPMRPSLIAAEALLARVYLSMGNYNLAREYAEKCLAKKSDLLDFNDSNDVEVNSNFPFSQFNRETIFYAQLTNQQPNVHPYFALIDSSLYSSYNDADLRKTAYFNKREDYVSFKGSYSGSNDLFGGIATDEIYLVRAESNIRLGDISKGLADLNLLLKNRWKKNEFIPIHTSSKEEALDILLVERRKELTMRGVRWIDLKRLNKEGKNIILERHINDKIYKLLPGDKRYALPLPTDVIQVSGMKQNEY